MTSKHAVLTRLTADSGKKPQAVESLLECPQCHGKFEPTKKNQKYCSESCRVKHWHFANAGQKVLADIQQKITDHDVRLRAIEAHLGFKLK